MSYHNLALLACMLFVFFFGAGLVMGSWLTRRRMRTKAYIDSLSRLPLPPKVPDFAAITHRPSPPPDS